MTNEMEQRVEPHNDYFSTQFLLNFAVLGTHSITVESSVRDANGIVWKTGPRTTMFVKSLEDPYSQQSRLLQLPALPLLCVGNFIMPTAPTYSYSNLQMPLYTAASASLGPTSRAMFVSVAFLISQFRLLTEGQA